jgi:hypothetical protein
MGTIINRKGVPAAQGGLRVATTTPVTGTLRRSAAPLTDDQGNFNAYSKRDLADVISAVMDQLRTGEARIAAPSHQWDDTAVNDMVTAMLHDTVGSPGGGRWVFGETLADAIKETEGRLGWTTKFLAKCPVEPNTEGRVPVSQNNVVSWVLTRADSMIARSIIVQQWVYPPVLPIATYLTVADDERALAPPTLMEKKYVELLMATMVREDNLTRHVWTQAAGTYNDVFTFADMTPALWSTMQNQVIRWALSCLNVVMASDIWIDVRTQPDFLAAYEPISKLTLLQEGRLGKLYESEVYTDGFIYPTLRVLEPGEIFFLASPDTLGGYNEYQPLVVKPADLHHIGIGAEGWYANMIRGYAPAANSRGLCWGYRQA